MKTTNHVCLVTVTYGNRGELLELVVKNAIQCGVSKVIIVDNGSEISSQNVIININKLYHGYIKVLRFKENKGTAVGFKAGIKEALNDPLCEYIWLLDDDNKPDKLCLKNLTASFNYIIEQHGLPINLFALISLRQNRHYYVYDKNELKSINFPLFSSFLRFHIFNHLRDKNIFSDRNKITTNKSIIEIPYCSYGGLFFHRKLIDKIGLPNENYFIYVDDTEYTHRIIRNGGKLFLVKDSKIEDISKSWRFTTVGDSAFSKLLAAPSDQTIYYSVRNQVCFEYNYWTKTRLIYFMNKFIFLVILKIFSVVLDRDQRYLLIRSAIRDGEKFARSDELPLAAT